MNKLCAIVGCGEPRDFVDAFYLRQRGFDIELALQEARQKDSGVDVDSMLFVLSDVNWERFQAPGVDSELVKMTATYFRRWSEELALRLHPRDCRPPDSTD